MKKTVLLFTIIAAMVAAPFSAAAESFRSGASEITLTGSFGISGKNAEVSAHVFKPGKTAGNITEGTSQKSVLIYHGQTTAKSDGSFSFEIGFPEDAETDYYTAKIACSGNVAAVTEEIFYRSEGEIRDVAKKLDELADAGNLTEFKNLASSKTLVLGIGETLPELTLDNEKVYSLMYKYFGSNTVDTEDAFACLEIVQLCEMICANQTKQVDNVFDYADKLGITGSRLDKFMTAGYVNDTFKKSVTSRLAAMNISNPAKMIDYIYEAFVLEAVYEPNGYTNLSPLLQEFAAEIGVQKSAVTSGVCRSVAGTNYLNYSQLKTGINAAGGSGSGGGGGAGGSGGGGGGGASSGTSSSTIVPLPPSTTSQPEKLPVNVFDDIASVPWAEEAIVALAEREVISGKGDNKFCPNDNITREEFAKIIALTFFGDEAPAAIDFRDVPQSAWYYKPVAIAFGKGIVQGIGNSLFGTGEYISRQDAAVMACRAAEKAGIWSSEEISNDNPFFDDAEIADYAKNAVYTLYGKGVVNGKGDSMFQPKAKITRAETAKIVYALLQM